MTKEEFISKVSKVEKTREDEFKAEFNSPDKIWEAVEYTINRQWEKGWWECFQQKLNQ